MLTGGDRYKKLIKSDYGYREREVFYRAPSMAGKACPRCGGDINTSGEYYTCMQCGYVDYGKLGGANPPHENVSYRHPESI